MAILSLGDAHWLSDYTSDARTDYGEGLRLAEAEHQLLFEAKLRLRLAQLDSADGQFNEGITLGRRALLLSQTLRDQDVEAAAWSLLADLYRKTEREHEAEEAGMRALAIYRTREMVVHRRPADRSTVHTRLTSDTPSLAQRRASPPARISSKADRARREDANRLAAR